MGEFFNWGFKKQASNLKEGGYVRAPGDEEILPDRKDTVVDADKELLELNKKTLEKEKNFVLQFIRENGVAPAVLKNDDKLKTKLKNQAPWLRYNKIEGLIREIEEERRLQRTQRGQN